MSLPRHGRGRALLPALTVTLLIVLAADLAAAPPAFHAHLLAHLANPNLDILLFLGGILLIYAEANLPGSILPGTLGTLLSMLALFGLTHLPLRPAALGLLALGFTLTLLDLALPARGLLACIGATALMTGLKTLNPAVHPAVAIATGLIFTIVTLWLGRVAIRARRNKQICPARFTTSIPAATSRLFRSVD